MHILERLSGDPRALVEIYLNYDCDRTALENLFQGYVSYLRTMTMANIAKLESLNSFLECQVCLSQLLRHNNSSMNNNIPKLPLPLMTGITVVLFPPLSLLRRLTKLLRPPITNITPLNMP